MSREPLEVEGTTVEKIWLQTIGYVNNEPATRRAEGGPFENDSYKRLSKVHIRCVVIEYG